MVSLSPKEIANILSDIRPRIDQIDRDILDLIAKRMDIIHEAALIKNHYHIPATLQDRVDEVRDNAVKYAINKKLDPDYIYDLWTKIIDRSCQYEDEIMAKTNKNNAL